MAEKDSDKHADNLLGALVKLTGQVAGGTFDLAVNTATMTAMFGETWLRSALALSMSPERHEAMAEAGHFLRDARETAGLSIAELAERLGLADHGILEDVESGQSIMPLEYVLRAASLLARHDPIPFLIKFMRTYNPQLERRLEDWGVMALPRNYERERRFINLYRQHDVLRDLSDDEYGRFIDYMQSSTNLVLDVMAKEKQANATPRRAAPKRKAAKVKKPAGRAAGARRKSTAARRS
jgi:transcriptional regulator with XRE-family HTH domain